MEEGGGEAAGAAGLEEDDVGILQLLRDLLEEPEGKGRPKGDGVLRDLLLHTASVALLAAAYMAASTGMITFNKFFMDEGRFPFVIFLGLMHMSSSFLCNFALYQFCPSLYPSLTEPGKEVQVDRALLTQVLLPIAACFSAQLVLSNLAFMHSSLAFLQMMKQSNVVLVYAFSLCLRLEDFSWRHASVLAWIVGATGLTVHGEMNFSLHGFAIQGCSMLCESLKLTLQSYSLSATGRRLDALTFVMLISPIVLLLLLSSLSLLHLFWPSRPEALMLPSWNALRQYWWLLLPNSFLAFAMNVTHALLIKRSSATAFILIGVVMKDVAVVVVGAAVLGEQLSALQVLGFTLQLLAILFWSLLRTSPSLPCVRQPPAHDVGPGWQELRPLTPSKDMGDFESLEDLKQWAGVLLEPSGRRPHEPSFCSNESTALPPLDALEGLESCCGSAPGSPCGGACGDRGL